MSIEHYSFQRTALNQMRIHVLPTDRFKTFAISIYAGIPLQEDTVTPTALTPYVLRRGTSEWPETIQFREKLDDLFGAGFGFNIYKRGDYQIVQFRMDTIHDQYVGELEDRSLLAQSLQFLGGMLTKPLVEQGGFRERYVEGEKVSLRHRIEAIINDKTRYAAERCLQEMCKHEPYRLHPLGEIESLDDMTSKTLYEHYQHWLQSAALDLYVVGDTTVEEVEQLVAQYFDTGGQAPVPYKRSVIKHDVGEINTVTERLDVTQGKLNIGLRLPLTYEDELYPAALMYNGILGAYPHSKLFINVREKASLAYYASSRLDGHKGILTIQSGIEFANYERTLDIIRKQLDSIVNGEISDIEMSQTRAMIGNQLLEIGDDAFDMIGFDFNRVLSGRERTTVELLQQIEQVQMDHIQEVAKQVQWDTIYFLRNLKGA